MIQRWWEANMTHARTVTIRAALGAMLGIVCLASLPAIAGSRDMGCSPTVANPCTGGGSGGGYSVPSYDYGAAQRAQEAAEAAAAAERQRQAEADRIERERLAEEKRQKDAAFIRDRDAAANTLKGSSGSAMSQLKGLSGTDSSGLKGSGFDSGGIGLKGLRGSDPVVDSRNEPAGLGGKSDFKGAFAKPNKPAPHTDTSVVDARNVPSGLPKALDSAIAKAYSDAPSGVSDRVRKGFQAVMDRDWKVAKAWFQDALNRDPDNAGLKRLVALTDSSLQANKQPDVRNEPSGLGGTSNFKGALATPGQTKPALASTTNPDLQLPGPNDMFLDFQGPEAMEEKEALDILFGLDPYPSTSKPGKTK